MSSGLKALIRLDKSSPRAPSTRSFLPVPAGKGKFKVEPRPLPEPVSSAEPVPGPNDAQHLFEAFHDLVSESKKEVSN